MNLRKASDKLQETVRYLAVSDEPIQMRLASAWKNHGSHLERSWLPEDRGTEYDAIRNAFKKISGNGYIDASCAAMSVEDATKIAARIVDLCVAVSAAYYRAG